MMITDYHTHVLPNMDDGANNEDVSFRMLQMLKEQGVEQVVATPHFYAHREKDVEYFLEKRQQALEKIKANSPLPILLGAEVAIEHNISELSKVEKLAIQGTNLILLEFPYRNYEEWMYEEIYNISVEFGLKVILAHLHRYLTYFTKEQMQQILRMQAIFQMNNEAFESFSQRNFVKALIKQDVPLIFGSDCHNLVERKPNWDVARKKCKSDVLEKSNRVLELYRK